ncbi:MAG: hypothetical protein IKB50_00145 [Clostridia bacterium]|nr:hypothetical protein [Clostridia bacterium]
MRMTKRIIAVMVAVMMVMAMAVCTVSAAAVVDEYEVIEFGVFNAAGTAPDTIGADKTVTVKATLRRVAGANNIDDSVSVVAAVYSGTELVDVSVSTKDYTFAGPVQDNTVQLTIPADKTNLTFKAFLWDGDMITPLAKASNEAVVEDIVIAGQSVDFDAATATYNVELPVGTPAEPDVKVVSNGLIDASVAYNDAKTVATVTVGADVYTINYTIATVVGELTNVSYTSETTYAFDGTANALRTQTVRPNLDADLFYDEATGGYTKTIYDVYEVTAYTGLDQYVTATVSNRYPYWFYMSMPEKFVGMTALLVPYTNPDTVYPGNDTITFTTNKSVRFYVSSDASWVDGNGVLDGTYTFDELRLADSNAHTTDYATMLSTSQGANYRFSTNMYKYEFILPEGQETMTATVKVKSAGTWDFPHIFYEFIDTPAEEASVNVTNVSYNDAGATVHSGTELKIVDILAEPDPADFYDEATSAYSKSMRDVHGLPNGLADLANVVTPIVANRYPYWFYIDMPEEFVGMKAILIPYTNPGTVYAGYDSITLTTDKDIRVYVSSTSNHTDAGAVLEGTYAFQYTAPGDSASIVGSYADLQTAANGKAFTTPIYSYDIIVPEGQATATATIKVRSAGTWFFPQIFFEEIK